MSPRTAIAIIIALCVVLSASMMANVLQQRALQQLPRQKPQSQKANANASASTSVGAFETIPPADLPGTYRWMVNGELRGTIILHEDGTITNWRGEKKTYQWQISDGALALVWLKDPTIFTRIITPGIYEGKRDGKVYRIEKEN